MATNVPGIAIVIRAFLPTGKTLDEQFEALSLVKDAHAGGDYSLLLAAATIDEVKTEQKVRRIEDAPAAAEPAPEPEPAPVQDNETADAEDSTVLPVNFEDGLDEPREEPEFDVSETIALIDGPLEQPADEPAPRRRMAR